MTEQWLCELNNVAILPRDMAYILMQHQIIYIIKYLYAKFFFKYMWRLMYRMYGMVASGNGEESI